MLHFPLILILLIWHIYPFYPIWLMIWWLSWGMCYLYNLHCRLCQKLPLKVFNQLSDMKRRDHDKRQQERECHSAMFILQGVQVYLYLARYILSNIIHTDVLQALRIFHTLTDHSDISNPVLNNNRQNKQLLYNNRHQQAYINNQRGSNKIIVIQYRMF